VRGGVRGAHGAAGGELAGFGFWIFFWILGFFGYLELVRHSSTRKAAFHVAHDAGVGVREDRNSERVQILLKSVSEQVNEPSHTPQC